MDLSGSWHVAPLDAELARIGADPDLDDGDWAEVQVPGHWERSSALATESGPVLYRRRFRHRLPEPDERFWLRFDGVLSSAEVWLDGAYLGDTVGYFSTDRFEITDQLGAGEDHLLGVDVACPPGGSARDKAALTGSLQSGPLAPGSCPGGIWRPVSVVATGPVAIRYSRLLCTRADEDLATLRLRLVVDSARAEPVLVRTIVVGPDGETATTSATAHDLAGGENRIEWTVDIAEPERWWPAALSDRPTQPLYHVSVDIVATTDGAEESVEAARISDSVSWTTGLRTVAAKNLVWRVNGQRLFCKSIAYGPAGPHLGEVDPDRLRHDVADIVAMGMDMVRVYGHVTRREFYAEADRLGLLVWQDMPLIGGYTSKVRSRVRAMARSLVDHLGHHPSVAVWCGHCEPNDPVTETPGRSDENGGWLDEAGGRELAVARRFVRHVLPSWNRSLLDPLIGRELGNADDTRPLLTRSGTLPTITETTDAHLWLGWRTGRPEDLADLLRRWPRLGAFPGGIGSQSANPDRTGDGELNGPHWPGAETGSFERYLPRSAYVDATSWALATRAYQADVLRIQIEALRRLKYRPTGGFCLFAFADAHPDGGFGVLDVDRHHKPAHDVVVDSCRPVAIVAEQPPSVVVPDHELSLDLHVVNDRREPLTSAVVTAVAGCGEWSVSQRWTGDIDADDCALVGTFTFTTPPDPGPLTIDLQVEATEVAATNRYRTVVIPAAEAIDESLTQ